MVKLSEAQRRALEKMSDLVPLSSYSLQVGLHTLEALQRRGLVKARHGRGVLFSAQTGIEWRITEAGRTALASMKEKNGG